MTAIEDRTKASFISPGDWNMDLRKLSVTFMGLDILLWRTYEVIGVNLPVDPEFFSQIRGVSFLSS